LHILLVGMLFTRLHKYDFCFAQIRSQQAYELVRTVEEETAFLWSSDNVQRERVDGIYFECWRGGNVLRMLEG
jgi:hypothetical protein